MKTPVLFLLSLFYRLLPLFSFLFLVDLSWRSTQSPYWRMSRGSHQPALEATAVIWRTAKTLIPLEVKTTKGLGTDASNFILFLILLFVFAPAP